MAEILSQEEIDALLSNVSGEAEEGVEVAPKQKIAIYDFKHPNLVSKEQLRLLETIHEGLCRNFGVFLSAQLRMIVEMNLLAIDQIMYSEFVMSIAPPSSIYVCEANPPASQFVLEINPQLAIFIVERLFGGQGSLVNEVRPISVIEQRVMRRVVDRIAYEISKNWNTVADFRTDIKRFESNPEFVQIVPSSEPVVMVSIEIKIHGTSSLMNICYPHLWISNILSTQKVQEKILFGSKESTIEDRALIEFNLNQTQVDLRTVLGDSQITVKDFLELKSGDVIKMNNRTNEPLDVYARNQHVFTAIAGIRGRRYAIRILDVVEKEG